MAFANVLVSGSFSYRGIIISFYKKKNPPTFINMEGTCATFTVVIREDLKVLPFADAITKAAFYSVIFFSFFFFFTF